MTVRDERRSPRARLRLDCTLRRRTGSAIACRTLDVGPGGMCVSSRRPLAADEELTFELATLTGRGRVLRQQGFDVYAIRFEGLAEPVRAELERLVAAG